MEEWRRKKIEDVYAKWEKKNSRQERSKPRMNGHAAPPQVSKPNRALVIRSSRYSNGKTSSWRRNKDQQVEVGPPSIFLPSLGVDPTALHAANNLKYLSIRYSCPRCVPTSKVQYDAEDDAESGLFNFLIIDKRKYGMFGRLFPCSTHVWGKVADYSLRDLRKDSLASKRVQDAVLECAKTAAENASMEYSEAVVEQERRAKDIVGGMSSSVYTGLARIVAWALLNVFRRLFNKIHVSRKHVAMLMKAQRQGVPIVFLPGHKSHMDYIIMSFALFMIGIHIPRIAAGDNLKIPLISVMQVERGRVNNGTQVVRWLVTHLGGFFIKRKLDTAAGKDVLYRRCLHEFMERSLVEGENLEFFIEGSRSRSGKPNSPKAGLLSVLVDSVQEGVVQDILVVPVGISYDVLLERRFVRHELMGGSKTPETFWKAMGGVWTMLTRRAGSIRIDFAQPFSLKEYLSHSTIADQSQLELTNAAHYRSILNMSNLAQRKVVTSLSQHIVHDITHCASLMSTSMVAFLLLTKHREGVTVTNLVTSYQWLEEVAGKKQRSVGFTGDASEAVHYALRYLKPLLHFDPCLAGMLSCDQEVFPRLQLPNVFQLLHHANQVTPMLVLEAIVACSLRCLIGEEMRLDPCGQNGVEVGKDEVLDAATFLCKILSREFIFAPPCMDVWSVLEDTVNSMVNADILRIPSEVGGTTIPGKKLPYMFGDSEDEEEECTSVRLQVNTEEWALEHLEFLQSILNPFLEGYWNTTVALLQMESTMEESEFLRSLQETLVHKAEENILRNVECCSMDTLRNAVKSMVDLGHVSYRKGTQLLHLVDSNRIMEVVERITDFKC